MIDFLGAMDDWLERGRAPDRLLATHLTNGKPDRTRPVCRYPQVAEYTGARSTDEAANFNPIAVF